MRNVLFLFWLTGLSAGTVFGQPQPAPALRGRVTDATTGQPLPFASVFINASTRGTTTDDQGYYRLTGVPLGTIEVVASYLGYQPARQKIRLTGGLFPTVNLVLKPSAALLNAVTVTAKGSKTWQRQFRRFKDALLGETPLANQCEISNGRTIEFSEKAGHLLAQATEPLIIENRALGYRLHYDLLYFDTDRRITYFAGTTRFEELNPETPTQAERWQRARQAAYRGSTRHLLASLIAGTYEQEGFLVYQTDFRVPNDAISPILLFESQRQRSTAIQADSLFLPGDLPFERRFVLKNPLEIFYTKLNSRQSPYRDMPFAYSLLKLPQGSAVVTTDGWVTRPQGLEIRGYLGGDRLAALLPADWRPTGQEAAPAKGQAPAEVAVLATDQRLDSLGRLQALQTPPSAVFLHVDKPIYTTGDRLWLSAYVLDPTTPQFRRADPGTPERSPALHVELLTPAGQLVRHQWQGVSEGRAAGEFRLSDSLAAGVYRLRAYPDAGRDAFQPAFERTVFIQNGLKSPEVSAPPPAADGFDVQFLPEGGRWVAGLPARLGVKALDRTGRGRRVKCSILDSAGQAVARLVTNPVGMGSVAFTPLPGQRYRAVVRLDMDTVSHVLPLPFPEPEGLTLGVDAVSDSTRFRLRVRASKQYAQQAVYLLVKSRGQVRRQAKLMLQNGSAQLDLPTGALPPGVCQVTLFDAAGRPWAERLAFVPERMPPARLSLTAGKPQYQPRERAVFALRLIDGTEAPAVIAGSVAVTDADQVPPDSLTADLRTHLLLTSALRGRIENPNAYLRDTQPGTRRALDDLLLTQGWRRLSQSAVRVDSLGGLVLRGRVLDRRGRPLPGVNVILTSTSASQPVAFSARADSAGNFRMGGLLLRDTVRLRPRVMDDFFKTLDATVRLDAPDGRFGPDSTPWPGWKPAARGWETARLRQQTGPDSYRDGDAQLLAGVTVRATKLPDDREARRASLHGTADATLIFDENSAQYTDVFQMLQGKVAGVQVTGTTVIIRGIGTLQGAVPPLYLLDGVYVDVDQLVFTNPAEIERIEVLKNSSAAIYGARGGAGVIAFFSKKAVFRKNNAAGSGDLTVYGFPTQHEFYVPRYDEAGGAPVQVDRRDVLYWNPLLTTNDRGIVTIAFPLSDVVRRLRITVQGITADGQPVAVERVVNVPRAG